MKKRFIPYTYRVTHIPSGKWYYGVRYAKHCHPNDLWVIYYTSSAVISTLIQRDGKDAFKFEVRKLFHTAEAAIKWERNVNRIVMNWDCCLNESAWPALLPAAHRKTHKTKSEVGADGLTGYQKSGKKWKEKQHNIDPITGLTYKEIRRKKHNESLDKNGTRARTEEFKKWFSENNPSKRQEVKDKIRNTINASIIAGTYPTTKGWKFPSISEKLKGNKSATGLTWYNNGVKDIRLKPTDPKVTGLNVGRLRAFLKGHVYEDKKCPHCSKIGSGGNMTRYHFDNCKLAIKVA